MKVVIYDYIYSTSVNTVEGFAMIHTVTRYRNSHCCLNNKYEIMKLLWAVLQLFLFLFFFFSFLIYYFKLNSVLTKTHYFASCLLV